MLDDVLSDQLQALPRTDDALELCPLALELLLAPDLLALGRLLEVGVDRRLFRFL
jgi:hypothetical protein